MDQSPETIDEVLHKLDAIIEKSVNENTMFGIFAYLYRRTTFEIKKEIAKGSFEDNPRMEKFDVAFANLYLSAIKAYESQMPVCDSWKISFDSCNSKLSIIQHMLMGMNAHINYDLGIAASTIMHGKNIKSLENDFRKVNEILSKLIDEIQSRISRVSRLMFILDWMGGRYDERIINYRMIKARHDSWEIANELSNLSEIQRVEYKYNLDQEVTNISERIRNPRSRVLRYSLKFIRIFEQKKIGMVISRLQK